MAGLREWGCRGLFSFLLVAGCGDGDAAGDGGDASTVPGADAGELDSGGTWAGDGFHAIDVPMPDGSSQPMWIYIATPTDPGSYPVVVYGHGQGGTNVLPECVIEAAPPTHVDVQPSVKIADDLAGVGYVGVAVFYRSFGFPPELGRVSFRDHYWLDTRSVLAAARWARDHHPKASNQMAFMGNSMGSFSATWAISPLAELSDLQDGLDIRASVASGMLGNHIANASPQFRNIDDTSLPDGVRAGSIVAMTYALVGLRASAADSWIIDESNVDAFMGDLTPLGRQLFRSVFVDAPPDTPECAEAPGLPVWCTPTCTDKIVGDLFGTVGNVISSGDWFTTATVDDFNYWSPPTDVNPESPPGDSLLALLRTLSPAYSLLGPLWTPAFFPLLSASDHTFAAQTEGSTVPGELYVDHMRSVGADIPDPLPIVTQAGCGHGDYYLPERPDCGWTLAISHLNAAFAQ